MAGAAIPEAMRVVALLRTGRYPDLLEWMATLILIASVWAFYSSIRQLMGGLRWRYWERRSRNYSLAS